MMLTLSTPRRMTSPLLGGMARFVLRPWGAIYCVDAVNAFDPYAFAEQARRRGVNPDAVLDRVMITRAFTIHQLRAVAEDMVPPLFRGSHTPIVALLGLDHLFLEETLPAREREFVLRRVVRALQDLPSHAEVLVTYEPPPEPQDWWKPLLQLGDARGRVRALADDRISITFEEAYHGSHGSDIQLLASERGGLLEYLSEGLAGGA